MKVRPPRPTHRGLTDAPAASRIVRVVFTRRLRVATRLWRPLVLESASRSLRAATLARVRSAGEVRCLPRDRAGLLCINRYCQCCALVARSEFRPPHFTPPLPLPCRTRP